MSLVSTIKLIGSHPLSRAHKLSSVMRLIRWQVGSRLIPGGGLIVYDWVGGSRFFVKAGETGLTGNIYTGLHEFPDMAFVLHFLRPDDLFVDVGANAGSYTILACSAIGARGVAFEPIPSTYKRLVENIQLNHLDEKVNCINKGVGAKDGTLRFTSDGDTVNRALAPGERRANEVSVEVISLDSALRGVQPSLMKIDVEGYERFVIEGASDVLKKHALSAVIMELNGAGNRYGSAESHIFDVMYSHGFIAYSYDPFSRIITKLQGKNLKSGNTVFIRNKSLVENRIRTAKKILMHGSEF